MDPDLLFVVGCVVGVLTIPALLSAFSEGRPPRVAAIMVLIAGTLIVVAVTQRPGGYMMADIPDAFLRVISRYLR